ncbi:MAG: Gfo/Idh/MocA family oxidoreductase [Brevinematales bacterium]|nr:Gfo/Idh/MocA family oxidoreductase [Brevinematales bacterium]
MIKLGIIGAGRIVTETHLPVIESLRDRIAIAGVYSPSGESAARTGYPAYPSPEAALADSTDALLIAAPILYNSGWIIRGLRAGKTVLCEKPAIAALAERDIFNSLPPELAGRCMIAENQLFFDFFTDLKKRLDGGEYGSPRGFSYCVERNYLPGEVPYLDAEWRRKPSHTGGFLYDWGVHHFSMIARLFPGLRMQRGKLSGGAEDGCPSRAEWELGDCGLMGTFVIDYRSPDKTDKFTLTTDIGALDITRERTRFIPISGESVEYEYPANRLEDSFVRQWEMFIRFAEGGSANPHPLAEGLDEAVRFLECYAGSQFA